MSQSAANTTYPEYEKVERPASGDVVNGIPYAGPQKGDAEVGKQGNPDVVLVHEGYGGCCRHGNWRRGYRHGYRRSYRGGCRRGPISSLYRYLFPEGAAARDAQYDAQYDAAYNLAVNNIT